MSRVLSMLERRVTDRGEIASRLGLTRAQVTSALRNLYSRRLVEVYTHRTKGSRLGRDETIYMPTGAGWGAPVKATRNPLVGTGFVFWPRNHTN